jgi:hypothetical protein
MPAILSATAQRTLDGWRHVVAPPVGSVMVYHVPQAVTPDEALASLGGLVEALGGEWVGLAEYEYADERWTWPAPEVAS